MRDLPSLPLAKQDAAVAMPFSILASLVIMTTIIVGALYCLDALHGERRDRSILFWKSLPVSDLTTVLSKAAVPLVVLPALGFALSLVAQVLLLQVSTIVLRAAGPGPAIFWNHLPFLQMTLVMLYGIVVHTLWHAHVYAWFLLLSGWARRVPFLWAILPPLLVCALEAMAFRTHLFASFLGYRFIGPMKLAFDFEPGHGDILHLSQLTPGRYLATPGLWIGLVFAVAFLAAAVHLRRNREPI